MKDCRRTVTVQAGGHGAIVRHRRNRRAAGRDAARALDDQGRPGGQSGVKPGDVVIAINGERIGFPAQVSDAISRNAGHEIDLTCDARSAAAHRGHSGAARRSAGTQRGDDRRESRRSDQVVQTGTVRSDQAERRSQRRQQRTDFPHAHRSVHRRDVGRQLQGPVGIAQLSGESAQAGLLVLLQVMAMISLNLGILNLMPVPVLDGGHILIMALEGIARRDFSVQVKEKMLLAGFFVLMMLMVTVIYNDLTRISWIERLMPWRN
jgi:regulator of sigma E protease